MGHVQFDPESVRIDQFYPPPQEEQRQTGTGETVPVPSTGPNAPVTKQEVPPVPKSEAVQDLEKRDPKRQKRAKAIKGRKRLSKTVVLKPEQAEGRFCSASLPVKKRKSDALGFY